MIRKIKGRLSPVRSSRILPKSVALALVLATGCVDSNIRLRRKMESIEPGDRIEAIVKATRQGNEALIPAIVDRLDDEDAAVRFYAILSLERLVGKRLGYSYAAPASERRKAVQAWRQFLAQRNGIKNPQLVQNEPSPTSKPSDNAEGTEGM